MKIDISPIDTGACPICKKRKRCKILHKLSTSMEELEKDSEMVMEIVIYLCPQFEED